MRYFLDTEFLEGTQKKWFGQTKPTIDLISIGIVAEDGRELYLISKDFNLKEAWNRYDEIKDGFRDFGMTPNYKKVYWIRENVLKPIFLELCTKNDNEYVGFTFTYKLIKRLINKYGKTNKQIAEEIKDFVLNRPLDLSDLIPTENTNIINPNWKNNIQFYGYYCDYDWVALCWLFGKMIDLPTGFPMYCIDLKQTLDEKWHKTFSPKGQPMYRNIDGIILQNISDHPNYPKQTNEHNALADARWNYQLYNFLNRLN